MKNLKRLIIWSFCGWIAGIVAAFCLTVAINFGAILLHSAKINAAVHSYNEAVPPYVILAVMVAFVVYMFRTVRSEPVGTDIAATTSREVVQ